MIPKVLHYIWFGDNPQTPLAEECLASWKAAMPDWEIKRWDESIFDIAAAPIYVRQAYEARKFAFVSDYVRLWALEQYGGVYVDTDVKVLKSYEPLLNDTAFIGLEESKAHLPGTCVMGCEAHCKWVRDMLALYDNIEFVKADGTFDLTTNVQRLGERMLQAGLNNITQKDESQVTCSNSNSLDPQSAQKQALGQISVQSCSNVLPDSLQKNNPKNTKNVFRLISQANAGVAAARNNGVAKSKGENVCFLDADDWWEANFLEEMDRLIKEYPEAGLYATNYIYNKPGKSHVALKIERGYINYPEAYLHSDAMPVWTGATCMPRKVFDEKEGFPVGGNLGEDFLLLAKTSLHYKVAFCEKPLACYNNDVPASIRATRNLHAPQYHMLFNMQELGERTASLQDAAIQDSWKALLDKLRVNG